MKRLDGKTHLIYCEDTDRWLMKRETETFPMHCGEPLSVWIDGEYVEGRLELDRDWYVVFSDTRFTLHKQTRYYVLPY